MSTYVIGGIEGCHQQMSTIPGRTMDEWKINRLDKAVQFLLDQRIKRDPHLMIDVIDVEVANDTTNKSIVLKVSNTILVESARGPNFIAILYVEQCKRDNLLRELLDSIQPRDYCRVFFVDELIAYPVGNQMVPKHELCDNNMVQTLLHEHSITVDALPRMLLRDPIARWYGWKMGDVIKITRSNGEVYHRLVVED